MTHLTKALLRAAAQAVKPEILLDCHAIIDSIRNTARAEYDLEIADRQRRHLRDPLRAVHSAIGRNVLYLDDFQPQGKVRTTNIRGHQTANELWKRQP